MEYFLGVDQGGTKTAAIVCGSDGRILGAGTDEGLAGVYFNDAGELYLKRIAKAAADCCAGAGISRSDISAVCGGMNGADWDFEYPVLKDKLSRALNIERTTVVNDCVAAMRGGSPARECAVVCAGSGLNAAVRRADGKEIIYGYYIDSQHQGAGALGSAALRKVMEASLGICGPTSLTWLVLSHTGYDSAERLMIDITTDRYRPSNKDFAPLLIKAFAAGDAEAAGAVAAFSVGVAKYITAGAKRLGIGGGAFDVVFSGGVFKGAGTLAADMIFRIIAQTEPNAHKIHARYEPVCGAALLLLDEFYDGEIPDGVCSAFDESAARLNLLRDVTFIA